MQNRSTEPTSASAAGRVAAYLSRLETLVVVRLHHGLAFCLIVWVFNSLRVYSIRPDEQWWMVLLLNAHFSLVQAAFIFAALLCAQALALRGAWRFLATLAFVLAGNAAALALLLQLHPGGLADELVKLQLIESNPAFISRTLWIHTAFALLLDAYYATREKEDAIAKAAQASDLERVRAQRTVVESRLKVMQARVEPELLFSVLDEVRRRYGEDRRLADQLLDELIAYLRAALPQMRSDVSTLGRESALARAYLKVLPAGREDRLAVEERIPPELAKLAFPSMVLLPLVHAVAVDESARSVVIDAHRRWDSERRADRFSVRIAVKTAAALTGWKEERIADIRQRLTSRLGDSSSLNILTSPDASTAELRWIPIASASGPPVVEPA